MRELTSTSKVFVFLTAAILASTARADQPKEPVFELAGDRVIVRTDASEQSVALGCVPRSFASLGDWAYALCAPNVVVMVSASKGPRVVERRPLREHIVSLTVIDGVVSARASAGVRPLDDFAVAMTPAAPTFARPRPLSLHAPRYQGAPAILTSPPEIRGLQIDILGTIAAGVDTPAGVATLLQGDLTYRFREVPFALSVYGTAGAATGSFQAGTRVTGPQGGDAQVATGELLAGVDTRFVAFSLGAGAALMNLGYDVEPVVVLRGRFGELDHIVLQWHMAFATGGATVAGVFGGTFEFRVAPRWWLGADAEFGNEGYGRFMLDVRRRISGDGYAGTLDLLAGLGLAYVYTSSNCTSTDASGDVTCNGTNVDYLGPALSVGLLWRP